MFPSGAWHGFWEQGEQRGEMEPLELHFDNGQVRGSGWDCVGPFTFTGAYSEGGRFELLKQYVGRHRVYYSGQVDGEGHVVGKWSVGGPGIFLPGVSGPFALWPSQQSIQDLPIEDAG